MCRALIKTEQENKKHIWLITTLILLGLQVTVLLVTILYMYMAVKGMSKQCDTEIESIISDMGVDEECAYILTNNVVGLAVFHNLNEESLYIFQDGKGYPQIGFLNEDKDLLETYLYTDGRYVKNSEYTQESLLDAFPIKQELEKYASKAVEVGGVNKKDNLMMALLDGDIELTCNYYDDGIQLAINDDNKIMFVGTGDTAKQALSNKILFNIVGHIEDRAVHDRVFNSLVKFGANRQDVAIEAMLPYDIDNLTDEDEQLIEDAIKQVQHTTNDGLILMSNCDDIILEEGKNIVWLYKDASGKERAYAIEKAYIDESKENLEDGKEEPEDNIEQERPDGIKGEYLWAATKFKGNLREWEYIPVETDPEEEYKAYMTDFGFGFSVKDDTLKIEFYDTFADVDYMQIYEGDIEATKELLDDDTIKGYHKVLKSKASEYPELNKLLSLYEETFTG